MKVSNIKDIQKFFDVVDSCAGKVELVTGEGDKQNPNLPHSLGIFNTKLSQQSENCL